MKYSFDSHCHTVPYLVVADGVHLEVHFRPIVPYPEVADGVHCECLLNERIGTVHELLARDDASVVDQDVDLMDNGTGRMINSLSIFGE